MGAHSNQNRHANEQRIWDIGEEHLLLGCAPTLGAIRNSYNRGDIRRCEPTLQGRIINKITNRKIVENECILRYGYKPLRSMKSGQQGRFTSLNLFTSRGSGVLAIHTICTVPSAVRSHGGT